MERRSINNQAQFFIVVFHKVMCLRSLGVVIYWNVIRHKTSATMAIEKAAKKNIHCTSCC